MSSGIVKWWAGLSQQAKGTMITVAGILVLSPDTLCIRLVASVDNWTVLFYRYFLQGMTMLTIFLCIEQSEALTKLRGLGKIGFAAGLVWGVSNVLFTLAVQNTSVANVLVIVAGGDLAFATVLSYLCLGERVPPHTIVCCLCAFAAILLTFSDQLKGGGDGLVGNVCAIFASFTMAAYFVILRLASTQGESPGMVPTNIVAGIFVGFISLCFGARPASVRPDLTCLYLVLQGVFLLPIAFALLTMGCEMIPAPEVSMIMLLETIFGPVWVALGGFEAPPPYTVYGGIILVVALVAHSLISLRLEAAAKLAEHEAKAKEEEKEGEEGLTLTFQEGKNLGEAGL